MATPTDTTKGAQAARTSETMKTLGQSVVTQMGVRAADDTYDGMRGVISKLFRTKNAGALTLGIAAGSSLGAVNVAVGLVDLGLGLVNVCMNYQLQKSIASLQDTVGLVVVCVS